MELQEHRRFMERIFRTTSVEEATKNPEFITQLYATEAFFVAEALN